MSRTQKWLLRAALATLAVLLTSDSGPRPTARNAKKPAD